MDKRKEKQVFITSPESERVRLESKGYRITIERLFLICGCFFLISCGISILLMPVQVRGGVYQKILEVQAANNQRTSQILTNYTTRENELLRKMKISLMEMREMVDSAREMCE